jgi:hypothetical protein
MIYLAHRHRFFRTIQNRILFRVPTQSQALGTFRLDIEAVFELRRFVCGAPSCTFALPLLFAVVIFGARHPTRPHVLHRQRYTELKKKLLLYCVICYTNQYLPTSLSMSR